MKKILAAALAFAAAAVFFPADALRAADAEKAGTPGRAYVIPIHGDIEPSMAAFVRRQSDAARDAGAGFLVYDIDTFGGRVDSALQISSYIGSITDAKTVAFVRSGPGGMGVSWSAGALIAMSTAEIYMAPGTSIGAAAPVIMGAEGKAEAAGEKTVSAVRTQMAALAEKNGHPVAIALAMVDLDVELVEIEEGGKLRAVTADEAARLEKERPAAVRRGAVISPKGKLLSLTAGEAEKYGLSRGTAAALPALAAKIGAAGEAVEVRETFADRMVGIVTSAPVQGLLILVGLVALFLEISTPGFGIPGTIALICFVTLFGGNAMLGTLGSMELLLFLAGVGLLVVELFILPGFGVTGISGILLIGLALVLSMQDFVIPDVSWKWDIMSRNLLIVASGIVAGLAGIGVIALAAPKLRLFDRLTLKTVIGGTAGGPADGSPAVPEAEEEIPRRLAGKKGVAISVLRPSGRAEFEGAIYSVEADGEFIPEGSPVVVVRVRGNRITVKKT